MENKKILITGGAGFIGSHIIEYFLTKTNIGEVRVLDNLSTGKMDNIQPFLDAYPDRLKFVKGDLRHRATIQELVKNVDMISHQAALGSVPRSFKNPVATFNSNMIGMTNLLHEANKAGVKRFVYASSSSIYGTDYHNPKVENHIGTPLSPYALSKLSNEMIANIYHKEYKMECIGLRYFNIFGPRQDPNGPYSAVIPKFINLCLSGKQCTINGDGKISRDFTFVDNAVSANYLALTTEDDRAFGKAYNVACGSSYDINTIYYTIAKRLEYEKEPKYGAERAGDVKFSKGNISLADAYLGYKPLVSFYDGIGKTIEYYKKK